MRQHHAAGAPQARGYISDSLAQQAGSLGVAVTVASGTAGAPEDEAQSLASLLHVTDCVVPAVMSVCRLGRAHPQQQDAG